MNNPKYAELIFKHLYGNINGYSISSSAREKFSGDTEKFLYGEMPFLTWQKIVERANPKSDAIFFDLGSGTGRVVIQSHLLFDFRKTIGVELLGGLHDKACEIRNIFNKIIKPQIRNYNSDRELRFVNENILDMNYSEAEFLLVSYPFMNEKDFLRLEEKFLSELKAGTKIVSIIRAMHNPLFKWLGSVKYDFSWGKSTAHFYEI